MNENKTVKGYKVFNPDWTCRDFKFEVGKIFEEDIDPKCCNRGFHFCTKAEDCFNYYAFDSDNKVAEVEALGIIDSNSDDSKCSTNKIHIIRELTWHEVLDLVNLGSNCTGFCNTGDKNTGDRNTGNWNTGDCNNGNGNTGNFNSGNKNTGNKNTGNRNTGFCNTGNWNTGFCNNGNRNTGNWNTGNCNAGDRNTGDWNTGDWNSTNYSSGCFNTEEKKINFFDKPSDYTYRDWRYSIARFLLNQIPKNVVEWIDSYKMTDEEKEKYPEYKTTGGYLKVLNEKDCAQIWWNGLSENNRDIIKNLPNFDAKKFEQCTGIKI